jgi:hypothetical protein
METLHSLERCDLEIGHISDVEGQFSPLGISVALLTRLCSFQTVTNELKLFLGFSKYIRSKHLAFSGLGPVERGSALSSIESFKRCHLKTGLIAVIIRELCEWQAIFPFGSISKNAGSKHVFQNLIYSFSLSSGLRVIGGAER